MINKTATKTQLTRYGIVSLLGYMFVLGTLTFSVEILHIPPKFAYPLIYLAVYIFEYISNIKYIFNSKHSKNTLFRYISYLLLLYITNNLLFFVLEEKLSINHTIAAAFVIALLLPVRFLTQKFLIFKSTTHSPQTSK